MVGVGGVVGVGAVGVVDVGDVGVGDVGVVDVAVVGVVGVTLGIGGRWQRAHRDLPAPPIGAHPLSRSALPQH